MATPAREGEGGLGLQDTGRSGRSTAESSAGSAEVDTGRAWAPPHLQPTRNTRPQAQVREPGERVPGAYMHSAVGNACLEVDWEGGGGAGQAQLPLAALVQDSTSVATLFHGCCVIGQWRQSRGCGGARAKKDVSSRFSSCLVLAVANLAERRLVLGLSDSGPEQAMLSACTRVIVFPGHGPAAAKPIDVTDSTEIKVKVVGRKRLRLEIVQADNTSLWLYGATHEDYVATVECIRASRSYLQRRQEVLDKLASGSHLSALPTASTPSHSITPAPVVPKLKLEGLGNSRPASVVPKLKLEGVGNFAPPPQKPTPALGGNAQPSVSSAVRAAEALLASYPQPRTQSNGEHLDSAQLTATTGHVYVQGSGEGVHAHPISRIRQDQLEEALAKQDPLPPPSHHGFGSHPGKQKRAEQNRNSVINVAVSASTAATLHPASAPSPGAAPSPSPLPSGVSPAHQMSAIPAVVSPPPRRLPRLVSVSPSPQKKIDADPHVMKQALANVRRLLRSSLCCLQFALPLLSKVGLEHCCALLLVLIVGADHVSSVSRHTVTDPRFPHFLCTVDNGQRLRLTPMPFHAQFDSYISENKDGPPAFMWGLMRERSNQASRQQVVLM